MNTQLQEKVNIAQVEHDLVRGEYAPEDAKDILDHLISKKINFHEIRSFSSEIRFGESDTASQKRIIELKRSKKDILKTIAEAEESGKMIRINATIHIEIA